MNVDLTSLFRDYPFLLVVGPVTGLLLQRLKEARRLAGMGLLVAAGVTATLAVAALGLAQGWDASAWAKAPFGILVTVALSSLFSGTAEHLLERLRKP